MEKSPLTVSFEAGPIATFDVTHLHVERRLGRVAEAQIEVRTTTYAEPDDLLALPARLAFGRDAIEHEMIGVVASVSMITTPDDDEREHQLYRIHVTSCLGLLSRQRDCRIFQDEDVQQIVSEVLRAHGIDDAMVSWRLTATYPKREMCVQYQESALAFVSRLLEEEGIFFFSEVRGGAELIVFEDDSTLADPIDGEAQVRYRHGAGLDARDDAVSDITSHRRAATGKVTLRDYDWKRPELDLTATASADRDTDLEVYDYPGRYTEPKEGARLASARLEALRAATSTLDLVSACPRILAGRTLTLVEAPDDLDGDYLITAAVHDLSMGVYRAHAEAIPKKVKWRTPQETPSPIIEGPQTAVIVAPPGSPSEEIHTDEHGRSKVHFHWDRYGEMDDKASCWIRVSQQQTSGSMILPRVGWEVIVEFLEGNPDRPIVTGRVFNGKFMPPYALPEGKSRTALGTSSSPGGSGRNEIRMEDKAGSEEVKIGSQKNTTLATGNNKTTSTAANETKSVGVDATLTVGADQTIKVTNGYQNTVAAAQTTSVGANRTVEVNAVYALTSGGASATHVGGNQFEMDGSPLQGLLSLAVKTVTEAAKAEAEQAMKKLDQAVSAMVNQAMGPINDAQAKADQVGAAMDAVSKGDLGAAAGAVSAASGLPEPGDFGASLGGAPKGGGTADLDRGSADPSKAGGDAGKRDLDARGGDDGGGGGPLDHASSQLGLDKLVDGALAAGADKLGAALGVDGGGGGGESGANVAGPDGAVGGNAAANSTTGPGHAINVCAATHTEKVGSIKATIAAGAIRTTVKGARTQKVGAARVELVGGARAETCNADKTEKAVGLVVVSKAPESETVGGARTTMVGGAVLEKIGASHSVTATGKAMFVGAFHKIDASASIVFKCGASEVVIDGGGVTIKAPLVTITAPNVTLTKAVSEA